MSCTFFNSDDFEYQQDLICGVGDALCELTEEAFAYFLAHGSLDGDAELN
tara:strand:- start:962 stop:1111 length:150 start_codon:yes stop_codon:yes gene_type:complete